MAPFRLLRLSVLLGAAVAGAAATAAAAAAPPPVEDMHDGCIHMQIIHSTNTAHFSKRAVELSLANRTDVAYYAKLNFGTPPQPQYVQLDTGSFELWINPSCAGLSTGDAAFCNAVGAFDPDASSTFASLGTGKQLRYGIGTANITYVLDDIALPGTTSVLQQVQFGVATTTSDEFSGILGIGYGEGLTTRYPNFVDALALQNVTRVKAFTLALGSKDEQEGVIVFGGVDTSKFAGRLARLPITPAASSPDGVPRYWVNLTSVALTAPGSSSSSTTSSKTYPNSALQVFLDSGSTLTLLPTALADAIAADFGAAAGGNANGFYTVDCSLAGRPGSLDFAFAGATVRVPYHELIRRSGNTCMLGIQGSADFVLLGDTFLRSAYVVIDQTDNAVWLAQYVNCGSTPAALASAASLTTLTGACTAADSLDMSSSTSSTASSSSSSSGSSSSSSSSPGGGSPASPPPAPSTGAGGQPSSAATPGGGNGASAANGGSTSSAAVRRPAFGTTLVLAVLAGPLMLGLFV